MNPNCYSLLFVLTLLTHCTVVHADIKTLTQKIETIGLDTSLSTGIATKKLEDAINNVYPQPNASDLGAIMFILQRVANVPGSQKEALRNLAKQYTMRQAQLLGGPSSPTLPAGVSPELAALLARTPELGKFLDELLKNEALVKELAQDPGHALQRFLAKKGIGGTGSGTDTGGNTDLASPNAPSQETGSTPPGTGNPPPKPKPLEKPTLDAVLTILDHAASQDIFLFASKQATPFWHVQSRGTLDLQELAKYCTNQLKNTNTQELQKALGSVAQFATKHSKNLVDLYDHLCNPTTQNDPVNSIYKLLLPCCGNPSTALNANRHKIIENLLIALVHACIAQEDLPIDLYGQLVNDQISHVILQATSVEELTQNLQRLRIHPDLVTRNALVGFDKIGPTVKTHLLPSIMIAQGNIDVTSLERLFGTKLFQVSLGNAALDDLDLALRKTCPTMDNQTRKSLLIAVIKLCRPEQEITVRPIISKVCALFDEKLVGDTKTQALLAQASAAKVLQKGLKTVADKLEGDQQQQAQQIAQEISDALQTSSFDSIPSIITTACTPVNADEQALIDGLVPVLQKFNALWTKASMSEQTRSVLINEWKQAICSARNPTVLQRALTTLAQNQTLSAFKINDLIKVIQLDKISLAKRSEDMSKTIKNNALFKLLDGPMQDLFLFAALDLWRDLLAAIEQTGAAKTVEDTDIEAVTKIRDALAHQLRIWQSPDQCPQPWTPYHMWHEGMSKSLASGNIREVLRKILAFMLYVKPDFDLITLLSTTTPAKFHSSSGSGDIPPPPPPPSKSSRLPPPPPPPPGSASSSTSNPIEKKTKEVAIAASQRLVALEALLVLASSKDLSTAVRQFSQAQRVDLIDYASTEQKQLPPAGELPTELAQSVSTYTIALKTVLASLESGCNLLAQSSGGFTLKDVQGMTKKLSSNWPDLVVQARATAIQLLTDASTVPGISQAVKQKLAAMPEEHKTVCKQRTDLFFDQLDARMQNLMASGQPLFDTKSLAEYQKDLTQQIEQYVLAQLASAVEPKKSVATQINTLDLTAHALRYLKPIDAAGMSSGIAQVCAALCANKDIAKTLESGSNAAKKTSIALQVFQSCLHDGSLAAFDDQTTQNINTLTKLIGTATQKA